MFTSTLLPSVEGYWSGRFQPIPGQITMPVVNPASGVVLAQLPVHGKDQAEAAVASAQSAVGPTSLSDRRRWLSGFASGLRMHAEEIARIITAENGKPLSEARGEVAYAAAFFDDAITHLPRLEPHFLDAQPKNHRWQIHHRPAGVAALITPWNFPVGMLAKKLSGAMAAGCPVVVKPSELTPLSCIAMFTILDGLGLPSGMVNMVFGDAPAIGKVLCDREEVRVISFTGSTGVGRTLAIQSAPTLKRLSLELGGNAPFVVFADADIDRAVSNLMANKFRCSGQTCVCTNRVLVAASVHDAFVAKVAAAVGSLKVGAGDAPGVNVGPLIDARGWQKVHGLVEDAVALGAKVEVGGSSDAPSPGAGSFFAPTVLTGVTSAMRVTSEEVFGPVVGIRAFADEAEAVRLANDTEYGLAAYVFSADPDRLQRVALQLHFGHVGLNTGTGPTPEAPFGGMWQSGLGREGGFEGILEFIELQTCPSPIS